jgi:hypothetical protein
MNFDKTIGSVLEVYDARLRKETEAERIEAGIEGMNLASKETADQKSHRIPTDKIPVAGSQTYFDNITKGDPQLASVVRSKQHLDQLGGTINDRFDTFRSKVMSAVQAIDNAVASNKLTEASLYNYASNLIPYFFRLVHLDNKTQIPFSVSQSETIENLITKIANTVDKYAQQYEKEAEENGTPTNFPWEKVLKGYKSVYIKGKFTTKKGKEKEILPRIKLSKNEGAQGEHWFALDQASTPTNWVIYVKKGEGGNLPFIREFDREGVWDGPSDIRKWYAAQSKAEDEGIEFNPPWPKNTRKPPIQWIDGKPQYGKLLDRMYVVPVRNWIAPDGKPVKESKVDFNKFINAVGDKNICEVIVAKYYTQKTGSFTTTDGKLTIPDLAKLNISSYGLAEEKAAPKEVEIAFYEKRKKPPVTPRQISGGTSSTGGGSSSEEEYPEPEDLEPTDIEGDEEDEF